MIGYFGFYRSSEVELEILNPGEAEAIGAGLVVCVECGGDGDWSKFLPFQCSNCPCVACKGTGKIYVSV